MTSVGLEMLDNDTPKEQPHLLQRDEIAIKYGDHNPSQTLQKPAVIPALHQLSPHADFIVSNAPQHAQ